MPFLKVSSIWYLVSCIRNTKYLPCRQAGKILNTKYCKAKGFTLIELLVVMTIIAILIAAVSASFTNAQIKGRDGKRKADLKAVQQALEVYLQVNGVYPRTKSGRYIVCGLPPGTGIDWGETFGCNGITYLQQLPKDPTGISPYSYNQQDDFHYILSAQLENDKDPDISAGCNSAMSNHNYCVRNP